MQIESKDASLLAIFAEMQLILYKDKIFVTNSAGKRRYYNTFSLTLHTVWTMHRPLILCIANKCRCRCCMNTGRAAVNLFVENNK